MAQANALNAQPWQGWIDTWTGETGSASDLVGDLKCQARVCFPGEPEEIGMLS